MSVHRVHTGHRGHLLLTGLLSLAPVGRGCRVVRRATHDNPLAIGTGHHHLPFRPSRRRGSADSAIVNVALPSIQHSLDFSQQNLQWVASGYILTYGGFLLLGGRLADLLPVVLPNHKGTFHREQATVELTPAGAESIICRLLEDPAKNIDRWKKLPPLMDYEEIGTPKPGAAVLVEAKVGSRNLPLLATENYGRGRTAVMATSSTWHWRMLLPVEDKSQEAFWQQLLRWLVSDTPGRVYSSIPNPMLFDDGHVKISADVRDKNYMPLGDARVEAHFLGPQNTAALVEMTPDPNSPGIFNAEWTADKQGTYTVEISAKRGEEDVGRDTLMFQRIDGVAENFHTEQNRDLLEKLSSQTGGRYWQPQELSKLSTEIPYSEAGITIREAKDLWNMPVIFLLILLLPASEWILRRKWGLI